jgi:type VI secretion system protein ImpJ
MKRLQPVIWSKGTLLTPQHLQIQDRFLESALSFQTDALNFQPWGLQTLQIDHGALAKGVVSISKASGILPDGMLFDIPDSDPPPPAKPLEEHVGRGADAVVISLALPQFVERGMNVGPPGKSTGARFVSQAITVRDETNGAAERPIQVARKNFRFLAEGESREGIVTLDLARFRKTKSGMFELDPQFVPPLLDIAASEYVMTIARRLIEILVAKSSSLSGIRRQKNQSLVDFGASDIANFWLLYTINNYIPILRHLFETRRGHPESLYSTMLALAATLTTFSTTIQSRDLPLYRHESLGVCFAELDEKLRLLLNTVVPSQCVSLPLRAVQPAIYATAIDNETYFANTKMFLAVQAETNEADLIKKTPQLVKVCSADQVEQLVRQALPGIKLTHLPSPPSAIPVKLDYQYFSLNPSGGAWESVRRNRNLAAYVPDDLPNPQLELLILLPLPV